MVTIRTLTLFYLEPTRTRVVARVIAIGIFSLFTACLWHAIKFGANCPFQDEWDFTQMFTGVVPVWGVITGHHNMHRYPLGQFVWYGVTTLTGYNFRVAGLMSIVLLGMLSWGLVRTAARIRGRAHLSDLIFPALLLNFGHAEKWLMGYELTTTIPLTALGGILMLAAACGPGREAKTARLAGVLLLIGMTGGGYGLAMVPPVAGWSAYLVWRTWTTDGRGRRAVAGLAPSFVAVVYFGYCMTTLPDVTGGRPDLTARSIAHGSIHGLGMTLGSWVGLNSFPWAGLVVVAIDLTALVRLSFVMTGPAEGPRACGLLAVSGAMLIASAAVLYARGGFADRNSLPLAVHGAAVLMTFRLYPLPVHRFVGSALGFGLAGIIVVGNWAPGIEHGRLHKYFYDSLGADLSKGMPVDLVVDKYHGPVCSVDPAVNEKLATYMDQLRRHKIGWFARAVAPQPFVEALAPLPDDPSFEGPNVKSLTIDGPEKPVVGVSISFTSPEAVKLERIDVGWSKPDGTFDKAHVWLLLTPGEHTRTFWVHGRVRELTIHSEWWSPPLTITRIAWRIRHNGIAN